MRKQIHVNLNSVDINAAIAQLEAEKERLRKCTAEFVDLLANVGIHTAEGYTGEYGEYIVFEREIEKDGDKHIATVVARDRTKIIVHLARGIVEVSPILMAEFGSGWFAEVQWSELQSQVGQGTFPDQHMAFSPTGWFWRDDDGKLHHSYGEYPTYPMFQAWVEMMQAVDRIGRMAFA